MELLFHLPTAQTTGDELRCAAASGRRSQEYKRKNSDRLNILNRNFINFTMNRSVIHCQEIMKNHNISENLKDVYK